MIIITGSITATPENFEELRTQSLAHVRRSRTEDGCEHHSVHVDAENAMRLVFLERWRDRAAVFSAAARRLAAEPPQIAIYQAHELAMGDLRAT